MSDTVRILPVYPWPIPAADLLVIKECKQAMNLPFKIIPHELVPGSPNRGIALRVRPKAIVDYAFITDPTNKAAVTAALTWALTGVDDPRATLVEDTLAEYGWKEATE